MTIHRSEVPEDRQIARGKTGPRKAPALVQRIREVIA